MQQTDGLNTVFKCVELDECHVLLLGVQKDFHFIWPTYRIEEGHEGVHIACLFFEIRNVYDT